MAQGFRSRTFDIRMWLEAYLTLHAPVRTFHFEPCAVCSPFRLYGARWCQVWVCSTDWTMEPKQTDCFLLPLATVVNRGGFN